eukprot:3011820-Rhodomonas_salina.1
MHPDWIAEFAKRFGGLPPEFEKDWLNNELNGVSTTGKAYGYNIWKRKWCANGSRLGRSSDSAERVRNPRRHGHSLTWVRLNDSSATRTRTWTWTETDDSQPQAETSQPDPERLLSSGSDSESESNGARPGSLSRQLEVPVNLNSRPA